MSERADSVPTMIGRLTKSVDVLVDMAEGMDETEAHHLREVQGSVEDAITTLDDMATAIDNMAADWVTRK